MKLFLFVFWIGISVLMSQAQETPEKKSANQIKGVRITYLPEEDELGKQFLAAGLKVGDIVVSYAGFPTTQEKYLLGIDHFLALLKKQWIKEGKPKDFWEKNATLIKKKTRGVLIRPVGFEEEKPVYELWIKRKEIKTNLWIEKAINFRCGQFSLLYQQKKAIEKKAEELNNLGMKAYQKGKLDSAFNYFYQTLELRKKVGEPVALALSLNNIGAVYQKQRKLELALEYHQNSLKLREQVGDIGGIGASLNNIGTIYQQQEKLELAFEHYKRALKLFEQIGNPTPIFLLLTNIGENYLLRGEFELALEYYQKALKLRKETNGRPVVNLDYISNALSSIGTIYQKQGKLELALQHHKDSLELRKLLENPALIAKSLNNIGGVYQNQGKLELALQHFQKSLKLYEDVNGRLVGNPANIARSLNNIGCLYEKQGKLGKALKYHQHSLKLREQAGNPADIARSLNNIGSIYKEQGKLDLALKHYQNSLKLFEKAKNRFVVTDDIAGVLNNIATLYREQGKLDLALQHLQESLKLKEQVGNPAEIALSLNNIGFIYKEQGKLELATKSRLKATEKIEYIANKAGSGRDYYFKKHLHSFAHTIELAYANHSLKAFKTLQYCKGFGFTTALAELALPLEQVADQQLIKQKNSLLAQISNIYKQVNEVASLDSSSKKAKLQTLEQQLKHIIEEIRAGNPAYSNIHYPKAVKVHEIQALLKDSELFLEYFCAPKEHGFPGYTYCFVIGKNLFEVVRLKETEDFNKEVNYFRAILWESKESEDPEGYYKLATSLYNSLLQPIFDKVEKENIKHLIIAPDENLNLIPFEAICIPHKGEIKSYRELNYLLDRYQVSYTMSATVYKYIRKSFSNSTKEKKSLSFFGIGDPLFKASAPEAEKRKYRTRAGLSPLPGTREELQSIAQLFPEDQVKLLLGKEAIEPALFMEELISYNILHFATHGLIDTEKPMYSSLALTPLTKKQQILFKGPLKTKEIDPVSCSDGFLQVRDIFNLYQKINAELVVLSACETGTGKIERGDGIVGLTRAFQFAGAPSIVVSLWSVNDDSTSQLMQYFYKEMLRGTLKGHPFSLNGRRLSALHNAKKTLRHSKDYFAPYFWAPFVLRGLP